MRRGLHNRNRIPPASQQDEHPLTVTALTRRIRSLLETGIGTVAVEGEIGRITRATSGHLYFTLKDDGSVIDAVMWRSAVSRQQSLPSEGQRVVARGQISVYEPRGCYQLVATSLRLAGEGDQRAKFDALVARLREEGLFDSEHKQALPAHPRCVGVVTSPTGAAVRDIIKVLRRRMPAVGIVVSPCQVQGPNAPRSIVEAMQRIDRWGGCDVMIVGRGGGSAEDLWCFNDERVARAIYGARTPVISAVGHEVDVTIADLVADRRAATPSEAAEAVVPDMHDYVRRLASLQRALAHALTACLREGRARLRLIAHSPALRRPLDLLLRRQQRLDDMAETLTRLLQTRLASSRSRMALTAARLEGRSPLGVLSRGYSVTTDPDGRVLRSAGDLVPGQRLITRLQEGRVISDVVEVDHGTQT